MESRNRQLYLFFAIAICLCSACTEHRHQDAAFVRLPRIPLTYQLGEAYLHAELKDTIIRLDSAGQKIYLSIHLLDRQSAKLWQIDTMHFRMKNALSNWDLQKHGYYWSFQDAGPSTNYTRDKMGRQVEVYDHIKGDFSFHLVRQPEQGQDYPGVNYDTIDEYWSYTHADAIGITNPIDGDLFVVAHPILKKVRGKDLYQKVNVTDSVAVPYYMDQVDSTKLICLKISIMPVD